MEFGVNGPVVVSLFNFISAQNEVSENGTTAGSNLEGRMHGKSIADLIIAMKDGSTYVNFHPEQNPNCEIIWQINSIN